MERADERVLSALATLHGNAEWQVVQKWLEASKADCVKTMQIAEKEVQLRWLQGSAQTLTEILEVSGKAMEIIHQKRNRS